MKKYLYVNHDKMAKIETAKKIIDLQKKVQENTESIKKLDKKIDNVREEGVVERRRLENKIKRSVWEVLQIALGNRKRVEEMSHRLEDTQAKYDKIEENIDWLMKTCIGLFITAVAGGAIAYFFKLF